MFRRFYKNWISSIHDENLAVLEKLQHDLGLFYAIPSKRQPYNELLKRKGQGKEMDGAENAFLEWIVDFENVQMLEIGCGLGWMYQQLARGNPAIRYTGVELSDEVIEKNRKRFPQSEWHRASTYGLPFENESFDLIFSFYVLEHLVFPENGLKEMLRVLRPGGKLVLIFPDFAEKGTLPSQQIGKGLERNAIQKLKNGKPVDASLSFIESRIILPEALRHIKRAPGKFFINITPLCLNTTMPFIWPDADAVYIANKVEIEDWGRRNHLSLQFPAGKTGFFNHHAFMVFTK